MGQMNISVHYIRESTVKQLPRSIKLIKTTKCLWVNKLKQLQSNWNSWLLAEWAKNCIEELRTPIWRQMKNSGRDNKPSECISSKSAWSPETPSQIITVSKQQDWSSTSSQRKKPWRTTLPRTPRATTANQLDTADSRATSKHVERHSNSKWWTQLFTRTTYSRRSSPSKICLIQTRRKSTKASNLESLVKLPRLSSNSNRLSWTYKGSKCW